MLGHFKKAGVPAKYIVKEFPITPDAHVPVGVSTTSQLLVLGVHGHSQGQPCPLSTSFQDSLLM